MIDPVDSLAFSIQRNPGAYALLLGSGVSSAAGVLTGREITLVLVRELVLVSGQTATPDLERWYTEKFAEPPNYSKLVTELAGTQAERQRLLRPFFKPTPQEREEGVKRPTAAHRSIARLVRRQFIRVIITTNFDRLIEEALEDEGITPTILSSPEQVRSMMPLTHTPCCLFKIHGDYLDTRILNTPTELKTYPDEYNTLLDRIFDDFGLVVCGWSAVGDSALCNAMYRTTSRRFTTYWAIKQGELASDEARRLIKHCDARKVKSEDADSFFLRIQKGIESLATASRPQPEGGQKQLQEELVRQRPAPASALVTGSLLGAWDEKNDADLAVIRQLRGIIRRLTLE